MQSVSTAALTNCPAQTCIALGADYKYGKQGLPDLPARLQQPKTKQRNKLKRFTTASAIINNATTAPASSGGSDSSKRRTVTTTSTSLAQQKRDVFPSSFRPYDDKILPSSALPRTKGRFIPATLSRSSNESSASSNSTSSTLLNNNNNSSKKKRSKKVVVIKKHWKTFGTSSSSNRASHHHSDPSDHESQTSVMEKSSTLLAASGGGLAKEAPPQDKDSRDHLSLPPSTQFSSSSASLSHDSSATSAKDEDQFAEEADQADDNENIASNKEEEGGDDECNYMLRLHSSRPQTEKVRCIALPLLKQRLGYLWEKKMFTDVIFLVGRNRQKIEAHRVILASCSEVFQSLLYSEGKPLQSSDEKYILYENDFSEPAFEAFIKAMYTNEIPICLTLAMALEVFYATKKYGVLFLEDQVLEHIRQLLTISNVFEAMKFSTNAVELTYLAPICWRIVEERTAEVLEYHLEQLDAHLFARILERERLSIDEVELFQFAIRWAANQCKVNGMKTTGKNKRHFLESLLKHFRFTTMNPIQFNEVVAPSRILDTKEIQQIQFAFHKASDLKNIGLPYKSTPRVNTAIQMTSSTTGATDFNRLSNYKGPNNSSNPSPHSKAYSMNGSGDGQQLHMICSDSAVTAPGLGSKVHLNNGKKGTSSTKLKTKRVPSLNSSKAR